MILTVDLSEGWIEYGVHTYQKVWVTRLGSYTITAKFGRYQFGVQFTKFATIQYRGFITTALILPTYTTLTPQIKGNHRVIYHI